jgi:hypothetical protein
MEHGAFERRGVAQKQEGSHKANVIIQRNTLKNPVKVLSSHWILFFPIILGK